MKQGTIILVPFPFTDLSSSKTRPALVVSRETNSDDDVVVVAISSKRGVESIEILTEDLEEGSLPVTSYIRFNKIVTLDTKLIKRTVGILRAEKLNEVVKKIKEFF